ncbi:MAG: hypothetical protein JWP44_5042 [Mucilaginibacter sp.]|nr:hypothetical protein [Mucilaginibacter sp.]
MDIGYGRLLSRPIRVHWQGWESDTAKLQQCGWNIAVQMEFQYFRYTLAIHNKILNLYAVTDSHIIDTSHWGNPNAQYNVDLERYEHIVFTVVSAGSNLYNIGPTHLNVDFSKFQQIDAQPQWTTNRMQNIADFNIFSVPLTRTQEILFDKADMSVVDRLEEIIKKQSSKQKEIRNRILNSQSKEHKVDQLQIVAQLVHYQEAA